MTTIKNNCKCVFQEHMAKQLAQVRFKNKLTQDKFAEMLMINPRSYSNLENGKSCCCALTLMFFLVFCCDDVQGFIDKLRPIILKAIDSKNASL